MTLDLYAFNMNIQEIDEEQAYAALNPNGLESESTLGKWKAKGGRVDPTVLPKVDGLDYDENCI